MAIPHLALPFRFENGSAVTVDQDSADEVTQCVEVLVQTVVGQRIEVPTYGISDPLFTQEDGRTSLGVAAAIKKWEPRAAASISDAVDSTDDLVRRIKIDLGAVGVSN